MSDSIGFYRAELRKAAARRVIATQRRRRVGVALAAAVAAVFVVGGALAAQTRWIASDSTTRMRIVATQEQLDSVEGAFIRCLVVHTEPGANDNPEVTCAPFRYAIAATCFKPGLMGLRTTHETSYAREIASSKGCRSATALIRKHHR